MGQGQDEIFATDSQASICMIAQYMDSPLNLQQCKHKVMLEDTVVHILARARKGLQNIILKVKSHIGIQGNEEADKLATAATDSSKCSEEYAISHEGLQGLYWPVQTVEKMSNDGNDAAEMDGRRPHISSQESRPSKLPRGQTLPCMWIYGTKLKANYFPASLNTYRHPHTRHNQSCATS